MSGPVRVIGAVLVMLLAAPSYGASAARSSSLTLTEICGTWTEIRGPRGTTVLDRVTADQALGAVLDRPTRRVVLCDPDGPRRSFRIRPGRVIEALSFNGGWTAWTERRAGRLQVVRRAPSGRRAARRITRVSDGGLAVTGSGDVVLLERHGDRQRPRVWGRRGRWRTIGPWRKRDRDTGYYTTGLWTPDPYEVREQRDRPDARPYLLVPDARDRCAGPGDVDEQARSGGRVLQSSRHFLRVCEPQSGRRRYLAISTDRDEDDLYDGLTGPWWGSGILLSDLAVFTRFSPSRDGDTTTISVVDVMTGKPVASIDQVPHSLSSSYQFGGVLGPHLASLNGLGLCGSGGRRWTMRNGNRTVVVADGFLVWPSRWAVDQPITEITYLDATRQRHTVPVDPEPGAVTVTPTTIEIVHAGTARTITPVPLRPQSGVSATDTC